MRFGKGTRRGVPTPIEEAGGGVELLFSVVYMKFP